MVFNNLKTNNTVVQDVLSGLEEILWARTSVHINWLLCSYNDFHQLRVHPVFL